MSSSWVETSLADVCAISSALVDPRLSQYRNLTHVGAGNIESKTGELSVLRTAEQEGLKSGKFVFDRRMILYSKIRPYLEKVARPDFDGLCSADIYPLLPREGTLSRDFLFHFHLLLTNHFTTFAIQGSDRAGMPKVNREHLFRYSFLLPPLMEQQCIVAILDEAFEGLAVAAANAEKNRKSARELFNSYRDAVFSVGHDRCTKALIGDVAEVFDGPHATPATVDAGPIFLGISALQDGYINLEETRHVTTEDFQRWTRRVKPAPDDVVFSYETRLGQAGIIPASLECCLGRRMGLVRVDRSKVDPWYFLYQYLARPFQDFLRSKTIKGATVDRISIKDFPSFPMDFPSLAEQGRVVIALDTLAVHARRLESVCRRRIAALSELKQSILQKAFAGELT